MGNLFSNQDIPQICKINLLNKSRFLSNCCVKKEYAKCQHCKGRGRILSESSLVKRELYE